MSTPSSRREPRIIVAREIFYYVNDKSVDLVVWTGPPGTGEKSRVVRLRKKLLHAMLKELR